MVQFGRYWDFKKLWLKIEFYAQNSSDVVMPSTPAASCGIKQVIPNEGFP